MLPPAETRNSRPAVSLGQSSEDQNSSSLLACVIVTTADSTPRSILQSLPEELSATSWKVGVSSGVYAFWTLRRLNWTASAVQLGSVEPAGRVSPLPTLPLAPSSVPAPPDPAEPLPPPDPAEPVEPSSPPDSPEPAEPEEPDPESESEPPVSVLPDSSRPPGA